MVNKTIKKARATLGGAAAICLALVSLAQPAAAQNTRTVLGQEYVPTVWIDPDGC